MDVDRYLTPEVLHEMAYGPIDPTEALCAVLPGILAQHERDVRTAVLTDVSDICRCDADTKLLRGLAAYPWTGDEAVTDGR